ncbi:MAG: nuclear transport factor 2 family protein [Planctomycetes bacterium]|nr:nuclear transport factor 2 family protein [Planctomycetota bacterium]
MSERNMGIVFKGLNSILAVLIVWVMPHGEKNMVPATTELNDKEAIIQHIHGLFQAYIRGDRDAVRHGHTADWRGFQIKSDHIVRGIDEYMRVADTLIGTLPVTRYELLDTEVQVYGDMAVVYYVSREWLRTDDGGEKTFDLRSVDIYRRGTDGWNQCGSNICFVPGKGIEPASRDLATKLTPDEEKELLAMRERLWYALFGNDVETIRTMVPDEVIAIDAGVDAWADGPEVLHRCAQFAKSGGKLVRLEFPDTRMQRYGDTVIMYSAYIYEIEREGKRSETRGRVTEVFIKRDGRWLNTGWHMDAGS